jgi:hypothetical protein
MAFIPQDGAAANIQYQKVLEIFLTARPGRH